MTENTLTEKTTPDRYDPAAIEAHWQARWAEDRLYDVDLDDDSRPHYYFLTMLPYPSGDLHIGHWFTMAPSDTRARYMRMRLQRLLPDRLRRLRPARRKRRDQTQYP